MKLLHGISFILMVISIESKTLRKEISFDNCTKDSWWMKNISLTPSGSLINIEANIALGEKNINSSLVKFSLTGCNSNFTCLNHTHLSIEGLNCTNNLTESEKEFCSALKIIEDWMRNPVHLKTLNEKKLKQGCIPYELDFEPRVDSTNKTQTESLLEPFLKNVPLNPPLIV